MKQNVTFTSLFLLRRASSRSASVLGSSVPRSSPGGTWQIARIESPEVVLAVRAPRVTKNLPETLKQSRQECISVEAK